MNGQTNKHTKRHTDTLIAILCTSTGGKVKILRCRLLYITVYVSYLYAYNVYIVCVEPTLRPESIARYPTPDMPDIGNTVKLIVENVT